jgi:hypothetical protein
VWLIAIGLSVISVVVNLPIDERPTVRGLARRGITPIIEPIGNRSLRDTR